MQESVDLRRGNAGGAQHLDRVLSDLRRECWGNLLLTADLEWEGGGVRAPVVRRREARIGQEVLAADPPKKFSQ